MCITYSGSSSPGRWYDGNFWAWGKLVDSGSSGSVQRCAVREMLTTGFEPSVSFCIFFFFKKKKKVRKFMSCTPYTFSSCILSMAREILMKSIIPRNPFFFFPLLVYTIPSWLHLMLVRLKQLLLFILLVSFSLVQTSSQSICTPAHHVYHFVRTSPRVHVTLSQSWWRGNNKLVFPL